MSAWICAACMSLALPALAQSLDQANRPAKGVPQLLKEANEAYAEKNFQAYRAALQALHRQRPYNSEYMYQLVLAHALLDEKRAAYNVMLQMQRQGLSYDFDQAPETKNLRQTQLYQYLNGLMVEAGQPVGAAEPVASLDGSARLPEAIAWDPQRERFLVGTVADGLILAVNTDGSSEELLRADDRNGIWGIHGLAVDAARNRLWASSAAHPGFSGFDPVDQGRSVLLEFQLDNLELLRRHPVPVDGRPHLLGKIAVADSGDVYVADTLLPIIYVKPADAESLRPYFASQSLVSLRGLALSDDGSKLYAADAEMGIVVVDVKQGTPYNLEAPETLNLGGIEGLEFWQGHLVIVQNGIRPQRLLRLELDPDGLAVSAIAPLAVGLDIMDMPTHGVAVGDEFNFFANSHWGQRQDQPVTIAKTSLDDVAQIVDPEAQRLFEQYEQAKQRGDVRPMAPQQSEAKEQDEEPPGDSG
ncbi:MAG: hypothetical protein HKN58_09540 [Xanthomonadales bacterium]|nr:hypothetical protein [Xanthomonadales bacterium]